ncbi:MAG: hypothetical protein WD030_06130 [Pirellulales bacterium]
MAGSEYVDDQSILDEEELWRRVPPRLIIFDNNLGVYRPTSSAFVDSPDGSPMSVVMASEAEKLNRTADSVLIGHEGYSLVSIKVSFVRSLNLGVVRNPLPNEQAHALVFGNKTKSVQRKLAKSAIWVIHYQDQTPP